MHLSTTQAAMSHHPSCRPTDKDLVWHCRQCGENEPAEALLDQMARLREALKTFGRHWGFCPTQVPALDRVDEANTYACTCGLDAALAQDATCAEPPFTRHSPTCELAKNVPLRMNPECTCLPMRCTEPTE